MHDISYGSLLKTLNQTCQEYTGIFLCHEENQLQLEGPVSKAWECMTGGGSVLLPSSRLVLPEEVTFRKTSAARRNALHTVCEGLINQWHGPKSVFSLAWVLFFSPLQWRNGWPQMLLKVLTASNCKYHLKAMPTLLWYNKILKKWSWSCAITCFRLTIGILFLRMNRKLCSQKAWLCKFGISQCALGILHSKHMPHHLKPFQQFWKVRLLTEMTWLRISTKQCPILQSWQWQNWSRISSLVLYSCESSMMILRSLDA